MALPENPVVTYNQLSSPEMIHIEAVNAIVRRVPISNNTWVIIDWSRGGARTWFVDDEGNNID